MKAKTGFCALHLTEHLCGLFGVLSLQGLVQKRVQASVHFLLSRFFILCLQKSQNITFIAIKYPSSANYYCTPLVFMYKLRLVSVVPVCFREI